MIVLDAGAALELLLRSDVGRRVQGRLLDAAGWHAPHLIDVEVTSALRRLTQRGDVAAERAKAALDDLRGLGLVRHAHLDLIPATWDMREQLTTYDGLYVSLAIALDAPVVTCDRRLAAASGLTAAVDLID